MLKQFSINIVSQMGRTLCRYRGNSFVEFIDELAYNFHRSLNNRNFNMKNNGELRVIRLLSQIQPRLFFNVRANIGKWSKLVSELFPGCVIHAFETVLKTHTLNDCAPIEKEK